jgi:hypothetical protein
MIRAWDIYTFELLQARPIAVGCIERNMQHCRRCTLINACCVERARDRCVNTID